METEQSVEKMLEQLKAEQAEVAKKIVDLDAQGQKGNELDQLHKRHEELTEQIESLHNPDELEHDKAA